MLVVIEGIDGSGKGTVTKRLTEMLNNDSPYSAKYISFPRYSDTLYGRIVGKYLNGDFGNTAEHPIMHGTLFALDRIESRSALKEMLAEFDFVFCDRYVPSNLCYSAMKAKKEERDEVIQHFIDLEYGVFDLPKPDALVFLNVPVDLAIQNIAKKEKRVYTDSSADIFEADRKYLKDVRSFYEHELERKHPAVHFRTIECARNGSLVPIQEIADEVFSSLVSMKGCENG